MSAVVDHGAKRALVLFEPVDRFGSLIEEVAVQRDAGNVVMVVHAAAHGFSYGAVLPGLLLPVRSDAEHAFGSGERTSQFPAFFEQDDV